MSNSFSQQRFVLFILFLVTLGWAYLLKYRPPSPLLAAESPLVQPWPTLVVQYPPRLDGVAAGRPMGAAVQRQAAQVSYGVHVPLPLATPLPDALPPTTALTITGEMGDEGWLRSPATLTFAIADNLGAGVSAYRLDGAADWIEREYYYPALLWSAEGIHMLEYYSLDMAHNAEAVQSRILRIDHTPPQPLAPLLEGNQLANGWFNTPVTVRLQAEDALSGLAALQRLDANAVWLATEANTAF